jgi:hypothetical protein
MSPRCKVGTERDRAGNRRLFMDQFCALILMSLFSPAIGSLRDLQRACALDTVRERLDLSAEMIAEMVRLRGVIEMFFRTSSNSSAAVTCSPTSTTALRSRHPLS